MQTLPATWNPGSSAGATSTSTPYAPQNALNYQAVHVLDADLRILRWLYVNGGPVMDQWKRLVQDDAVELYQTILATDRAHRIGQDKPVFVYNLIAAGTVEERIQQMQAEKQALADGLLGGAAQAKLPSPEEIAELFAPLA